jgi:RNA ligase
MNISDFAHLRNDPRIKFKEETVNGQSFIIVCYMIADTSLWKIPMALEARGITFNSTSGRVVSRPFEKFFNLNENEWTQDNSIEWDRLFSVYSKIDGSLVTPVLLNDSSIVCKTKKSFHNDIAKKATKFLNSSWKIHKFCFDLLDNGLCPIFEFTHPDHQIVINYGDVPTMSLLAIRCMDTGHYFDHEQWDVPDQLKVVKDLGFDKSRIEKELNEKGKEGFVIFFPHTEFRVKMKSEWYLSLHRIKTVIRPRDIAEAVLSETLDDIKSTIISEFSDEVDIEPILAIEKSVVDELNFIRLESEKYAEASKDLEQKEFALTFKQHPFFPLIAMIRKGVDIVDNGALQKWFRQNRLKQNYGLEAIYNKNF